METRDAGTQDAGTRDEAILNRAVGGLVGFDLSGSEDRGGSATEARTVTADWGCAFAFEGDAAAIDAELRRMAAVLAERDLALGRLAEAFWKSDGWRRLGYATPTQYARERLGTCLSSIKAKRALARRAEVMPQLSTALANGELSYEAARLVASVATPTTVEPWMARAAERTVRHLREEVDAVQMLARIAPGSSALPPDEPTMQALAAVESRVVSGAVFQCADGGGSAGFQAVDAGEAGREVFREFDGGQMSADLVELFEAFEHARGRPPVGRRSSCVARSGRVSLRFRLTAETQRYYR